MKNSKADILNRLRAVEHKCGPFTSVVANVARGFETGLDPQGAPSTRKDEAGALCGLAQVLERMGKVSVGVELVLIAKAIQDFREVVETKSTQITQCFVDKGDGTLLDNQTHLMWQKKDDGQCRTLRDSEVYCKALTLGGHRDWRLPTIDELLSVSRYWRQIFANPKDDTPYWSSTVIKNPYPQASESQKYAAKVMFSSGEINQYFIAYQYYTRAVRTVIGQAKTIAKGAAGPARDEPVQETPDVSRNSIIAATDQESLTKRKQVSKGQEDSETTSTAVTQRIEELILTVTNHIHCMDWRPLLKEFMSLGSAAVPPILAVMQTGLKDSPPHTRAEAYAFFCTILGAMKDARAVPVLISTLNTPIDDQWEEERRILPVVISALGDIGDKRAISAIQNILDLHPEVALAAGEALKKLAPELDSEDPRVVLMSMERQICDAEMPRDKERLNAAEKTLFSLIEREARLAEQFKRMDNVQVHYAWYLRGECFRKLGNNEQAIDCYRQALRVCPSPNSVAHIRLRELDKTYKGGQ